MISNEKIYDVCIVGLGPAGIGAALTLSNSKEISNVLCIDAGISSKQRVCNVLRNQLCRMDNPCQMISGFGGCSLLSSGKISNYPAGSALGKIVGSDDIIIKKMNESINILSRYVKLDKSIIEKDSIDYAFQYFSSLGFVFKYYDVYRFSEEELKDGYEKIHQEIINAGVSIMLSSKLVKVTKENNLFKILVESGGDNVLFTTRKLILGTGKLGEEYLSELDKQMNLGGEVGYFDIGVRLEFPTSTIPDITKYHKDLKLKFGDARTYCISKNGRVALFLNDKYFYTEGYSSVHIDTSFTNIAILQRLSPTEHNKIIFEELKRNYGVISNGRPMAQSLCDYLNMGKGEGINRNGFSLLNAIYGNINDLFPASVSEEIFKSVSYFVSKLIPSNCLDRVFVYAPEVDFVRTCFQVKPDFSVIPGLYIIGSGLGHFRGILQSFCSGIICAEGILGDEYAEK